MWHDSIDTSKEEESWWDIGIGGKGGVKRNIFISLYKLSSPIIDHKPALINAFIASSKLNKKDLY